MVGIPVFDLDTLRAHETEHAALKLMERAGTSAAKWLLARSPRLTSVLVIAGPGNNGGDAFVMARVLAEAGKQVQVYLTAEPPPVGSPARHALAALKVSPKPIILLPELPERADHCDWVVDGIFGIGLNRPPDGQFAEIIDQINRYRSAHTQILALDVPSGVDALTGDVYYPAVVADVTLTFLAHKAGLWTGAALDYIGALVMLDCGVPAPQSATEAIVVRWDDVAHGLPTRLRTAHKGDAGSVMVVGGAPGMAGAALLAGRAALRAGAGKVHVGFAGEVAPQVDILYPELMLEPFTVFRSPLDAIVLGPGLSTSRSAKEVVMRALSLPLPLVLDADALNIIHADFGLRDRMRTRQGPTIATPHPGEAARLLNITVEQVNADRIASARMLSENLRAHVVLKGAGSVSVSTSGATTINATGNPLLATAGSGDVLAGMIGALLAQALQPYTALVLAVAWHGHIADLLAKKGVRHATASDIVSALAGH